MISVTRQCTCCRYQQGLLLHKEWEMGHSDSASVSLHLPAPPCPTSALARPLSSIIAYLNERLAWNQPPQARFMLANSFLGNWGTHCLFQNQAPTSPSNFANEASASEMWALSSKTDHSTTYSAYAPLQMILSTTLVYPETSISWS